MDRLTELVDYEGRVGNVLALRTEHIDDTYTDS